MSDVSPLDPHVVTAIMRLVGAMLAAGVLLIWLAVERADAEERRK